MEGRPFPQFGLDPNTTPMPLDNFSTDTESNTGSRILLAGIQPLKNHKYFFEILRINTDAVVPDGKNPFRLAISRTDMNFGIFVAAKFYGITD